MDGLSTVPQAEAEQICRNFRERRRWYNLALWQCWGCVKFSHGDPHKMCGEIVGCNLVVKAYRKQQKP
jgi:hypothetical protein